MSDMALGQLRRKYALALEGARAAHPATATLRGEHATTLRAVAWNSVNDQVSWRIAYQVTHGIDVPQDDINLWRAIDRHLDRLSVQSDRRGRIRS